MTLFPADNLEIAPVSTVEAIRRALEAMAFAGELPAGTPLRENEIAERFSVGRPSARAALAELVRDGVAIHEPNRGVFARGFSSAEIVDVFNLRGAIETEAVRRIRGRRLPRREVDAALSRLAGLRPSDLDGMVFAGIGVHRALVADSDSPRLVGAWDSMHRELRVALAQAQVAVAVEAPEAVLREHEELVDDLWTLRPAQAVRRIRAHTEQSMADVIAAIAR